MSSDKTKRYFKDHESLQRKEIPVNTYKTIVINIKEITTIDKHHLSDIYTSTLESYMIMVSFLDLNFIFIKIRSVRNYDRKGGTK